MSSEPVVSKLAEWRLVSFSLWEKVARRAGWGCISCPHPALRATLSQRERDIPETGFQIENPMKPASILLLERTGSRNLDKSGSEQGRSDASKIYRRDCSCGTRGAA